MQLEWNVCPHNKLSHSMSPNVSWHNTHVNASASRACGGGSSAGSCGACGGAADGVSSAVGAGGGAALAAGVGLAVGAAAGADGAAAGADGGAAAGANGGAEAAAASRDSGGSDFAPCQRLRRFGSARWPRRRRMGKGKGGGSKGEEGIG